MSQSLVEKYGVTNGFSHAAVCLTTGPQSLPKRVLHTVRSSVSSFSFQNPRLSSTSSSCLLLLRRLPVTSILPFNNLFQKAVPTLDVTDPVYLPSFYCMCDIPFFLDSM